MQPGGVKGRLHGRRAEAAGAVEHQQAAPYLEIKAVGQFDDARRGAGAGGVGLAQDQQHVHGTVRAAADVLHTGLVVDDDRGILVAELVQAVAQQVIDVAVTGGTFLAAHDHHVETRGLGDFLVDQPLDPFRLRDAGRHLFRIVSQLLSQVAHRTIRFDAQFFRQATIGVGIYDQQGPGALLEQAAAEHGGEGRFSGATFSGDGDSKGHGHLLWSSRRHPRRRMGIFRDRCGAETGRTSIRSCTGVTCSNQDRSWRRRSSPG